MNTMHELLMPELNESKIAERLADAASRRWARAAIQAARPSPDGIEARFHLPRLRRRSTAGAI